METEKEIKAPVRQKGFVQEIRKIDSEITSMELIRSDNGSFDPISLGKIKFKFGIFTRYDRFFIYPGQTVCYRGSNWRVEELYAKWTNETLMGLGLLKIFDKQQPSPATEAAETKTEKEPA